jgi:hypothetical protein
MRWKDGLELCSYLSIVIVVAGALIFGSCDAGTLYSNPDAPEGTLGLTPYAYWGDGGLAGLEILWPVARRVTLRLDGRRRWYDEVILLPSGIGAASGHPGWRDDDDDCSDHTHGDRDVTVEVHNHYYGPEGGTSATSQGLVDGLKWDRDSEWIVGGSLTLWLGGPYPDMPQEPDVPRVVPWDEIERRMPPE